MSHRTPFVKIPLNRGKVALVSPEDAERVLRHRWYADRNRSSTWRAKATIKGRGFSLHRFILGYSPDDPDIDHKNGNGIDCRRENLRDATQSQNQANRRKQSTMPYRGITKEGRGIRFRWGARIRDGKKTLRLGSFLTPEEAARAYDEAARRIYGEFACVNFPREGERRAV